jgi:inorganic pyrophosphatase
MDKIARLAPFDSNGAVRVVVESPGGAAVKLKYDPQLGLMTLGRPLPLGLRYPCDWGFVPGTEAEDGDPVDAFVVADAPTFPGVVISCRLLGVIQADQDHPQRKGRVRNDRLVALPVTAPRAESLRRYADLPERVRAELEAFLLAAVQFEGKNVAIIGRAGPAAATALIERCRVRGPRTASNKRR